MYDVACGQSIQMMPLRVALVPEAMASCISTRCHHQQLKLTRDVLEDDGVVEPASLAQWIVAQFELQVDPPTVIIAQDFNEVAGDAISSTELDVHGHCPVGCVLVANRERCQLAPHPKLQVTATTEEDGECM